MGIYGHTLRNPYTGTINVTINIEYVQPLLKADLTEAEVYTQFTLWYNLFHELSHALFWTTEMQTKHPQICASEIRAPFFEQEPYLNLDIP